jgi:hypothetical protein
VGHVDVLGGGKERAARGAAVSALEQLPVG